MYASTGVLGGPSRMTSAASRLASRGNATTSGATTANRKARTPRTTTQTTVRSSAGRVFSRPRIDAAPVATTTKAGTRRKLRYRGITYASLSQRAVTVTTIPAQSTRAERHSRSNGLAAATIAASATAGSQIGPGLESGAVDPDQRRQEDLVDRSRDDPREADLDAVRNRGCALDGTRVWGVEADDRCDGEGEARSSGQADTPI